MCPFHGVAFLSVVKVKAALLSLNTAELVTKVNLSKKTLNHCFVAQRPALHDPRKPPPTPLGTPMFCACPPQSFRPKPPLSHRFQTRGAIVFQICISPVLPSMLLQSILLCEISLVVECNKLSHDSIPSLPLSFWFHSHLLLVPAFAICFASVVVMFWFL